MSDKKVVIWGNFQDYEAYKLCFDMEVLKHNIEIVGLMFLDEDVVKNVDGYPVIKIESLLGMQVDYVIALGNDIFEDMKRILVSIGIAEKQVLPGRIFQLPNFDFAQYITVCESKISIISDNCWGGFTYHSLGMPFYSPFINMFVKKGDFGRLVMGLHSYMEQSLEYIGNGFDKRRQKEYPICNLGDVELHFNHYENYESAVRIWEARKARLNYDNLFVKMLIETEKDLEDFLQIPYRKIGFSQIPCEHPDIINGFSKSMKTYVEQEYQGRFWEFVNWQARSDRVDLKQYEILKLLLGEEDYMRVQVEK